MGVHAPTFLVDGVDLAPSGLPCDYNKFVPNPPGVGQFVFLLQGHGAGLGNVVVTIGQTIDVGGFPFQVFFNTSNAVWDPFTQTATYVLHYQPAYFGAPDEFWTVTLSPSLPVPSVGRNLSIPSCSVCGYVVDFLRSCYVSRWKLYTDNPSTIKGRYYFSPNGTIAYPSFHLFGSQTWHDKNHPVIVPLGEVPGKTEWYNGASPVVTIPARRIGSAECIEMGEMYANRVQLDVITDGVPSACFDSLNRPSSPTAFLFDVANCVTQRFYASVISLMYEDDVAQINSRFDAIFGDVPYTFARQASAGTLPQFIVVTSGNLALLLVDGTRDFQTLALQAAQSLRGPTGYGGFSTLPLWYRASVLAVDFLRAQGVDDAHRIVSVGHSYGAAVCGIANARLIHAGRGQPPRLLTFGCPKPGDFRLVNLLNTPESIFLVDDDDIVAILPPDVSALQPLLTSIGVGPLAYWPQWASPRAPTIMDEDGIVRNQFALGQATSVLLEVAQDLLNADPVEAITGHLIAEYARRLALRCP